MCHNNGCAALYDSMTDPRHEDDAMQLEIERVFNEIMEDGESYVFGQAVTFEQVKLLAADDFALDERIAALAMDPLDSDYAMGVKESLEKAVEQITEGAMRDAE